mgnify:CR=1 FL=1
MKFDHDNISPLDSRYAAKISNFRKNFSESALIKIRFEIELEWLIYLCTKLPKIFKPLSKQSIKKIEVFRDSFTDKYVLSIKKIESTTPCLIRLQGLSKAMFCGVITSILSEI